MSPRILITLVAISVVILGLGGLVAYSQIANANSNRPIWVVNASVNAGDKFTTSNVQKISVPGRPDQFAVYTDNPVGKHSALDLKVGHPLTPEDVITIDLSEVPVLLKDPPPLSPSDSIDVYAFFNGNTVVIGKHLIVRSALTPVTVLVPTDAEPAWITLLANQVPLYAAKSNGLGVPSTNLAAAEAINQLIQNPLPATSPGASPLPGASPSPSPKTSP